MQLQNCKKNFLGVRLPPLFFSSNYYCGSGSSSKKMSPKGVLKYKAKEWKKGPGPRDLFSALSHPTLNLELKTQPGRSGSIFEWEICLLYPIKKTKCEREAFGEKVFNSKHDKLRLLRRWATDDKYGTNIYNLDSLACTKMIACSMHEI